jgi:hypothetical protein
MRSPLKGNAVDEIDIWRSARLLINQHSESAELAAARRVDQMIGRGDPAGEETWKLILGAIRVLQSNDSVKASQLH